MAPNNCHLTVLILRDMLHQLMLKLYKCTVALLYTVILLELYIAI